MESSSHISHNPTLSMCFMNKIRKILCEHKLFEFLLNSYRDTTKYYSSTDLLLL